MCIRDRDGKTLEDIPLNSLQTIHYFGYFAMVCQLRLSVMIGEFREGIVAILPIDNRRLPILSKAYACYTSLFYYVGFSYLMQGRYRECVGIFVVLLSFMLKYKQFYSKSFQFDAINKLADKTISLLALSLLFYPTTLEDSLHTVVREKLGDKLERINKYDIPAFLDAFNFGCPKIITPVLTVENFANFAADKAAEPLAAKREYLLGEFQKIQLLNNLASVLTFYNSIHIGKLEKVLKISRQELNSLLEAFKGRNQIKLGDNPFESTILSRFMANLPQIDFSIENDTFKINNLSKQTNYSKLFLKQSSKLEEMSKEVLF
eukprot:TRINITY_DN4955_c0_g4_i1.p1 TRINITY_DN4955_c0_g4~~TRINITY_DN4955_c0_g4_i1.p1  ORF type:complete len:319 (-),score=120.71 TRINITY_DN4955_c0_g4_i1:158-1114(-)